MYTPTLKTVVPMMAGGTSLYHQKTLLRNLMKNILFLFICLVSTAFGDQLRQIGSIEQARESYNRTVEWVKAHPGVPPPLTPEEDYEIFGKDNLPRPGTGLHILPAHKMHYTETQIENIKKYVDTLKNQGYIEKYNQNAAELIVFKQTAMTDYANHHTLTEQSTHLRHTISELKMAYDYQGIHNSLTQEVIGFAPESTFMDGWAGAVEFFIPASLTCICAYHETNIFLTQSSANFAEEVISNDHVNGKTTIVEVLGNDVSGYEYNIEWWDDQFRHTLVCASKKFHKTTTQKIRQLAINIDKLMLQ